MSSRTSRMPLQNLFGAGAVRFRGCGVGEIRALLVMERSGSWEKASFLTCLKKTARTRGARSSLPTLERVGKDSEDQTRRRTIHGG